MKTAIRAAYTDGSTAQEREILDAIEQGFSARQQTDSLGAGFFTTNRRKLDALVDATTKDVKRAETAILRRANDQYRKIIFNAQVYANTGAGTYEKAVDMATKDFLAAGLQCVVYANGSRHTLSDYADMALRTTSKRAYLAGEGTKRQEWGVATVILNKRSNACPKCAKFCGKVFIDDVWSGGTASSGDYPLLSSAIRQGLYHPRCKDSHTTYFPGLTEEPAPWTGEELRKLGKTEEVRQKQQHAQRQAEKYRRLERFSLDGENQRKYKARAQEWEDTSAMLENSVANTAESGIIESIGNNKPRSPKLEKAIKKCIEKETAIFTPGKAGEYCRKVAKKPDFYDVSFHGAPQKVFLNDLELTPDIVANILNARKDYHNEPIRLLSCSTGAADKNGDCFAQSLADLLGVPVEAPNNTLWVWPSGRFSVGTTQKASDGAMVLFKPRKDVT